MKCLKNVRGQKKYAAPSSATATDQDPNYGGKDPNYRGQSPLIGFSLFIITAYQAPSDAEAATPGSRRASRAGSHRSRFPLFSNIRGLDRIGQ
jgi:hypothetical protein